MPKLAPVKAAAPTDAGRPRSTRAAGRAGGRGEKRYTLGTHRVCPPEETWQRIAPRFEHVGITRVADVTGLDRLGVPVYQAIRPTSRSLCVSQGKGLDPAASRVGAAMESIELWHAERLDHLPQVSMTLQEMRSCNPIRQEELRWLRRTRILDAAPLRWIEARSLVDGRSAWLPRDMIELDFGAPHLFRPQLFVRNSNGLASGNSIEEALLHSLCEWVERHSWHLAVHGAGRPAAIDPRSITARPLVELMDSIRGAGMKFALFETTCDIGLPAVFARLAAADLPVTWQGFGCHTSAEIAISRALTEVAQSRLCYIAGARDDLMELARGAPPHREFVTFSEPRVERDATAMADLSTDSVTSDLDRVVRRLADSGYEPFWVDLTREELAIPVVLTFVPGLREMHG